MHLSGVLSFRRFRVGTMIWRSKYSNNNSSVVYCLRGKTLKWNSGHAVKTYIILHDSIMIFRGHRCLGSQLVFKTIDSFLLKKTKAKILLYLPNLRWHALPVYRTDSKNIILRKRPENIYALFFFFTIMTTVALRRIGSDELLRLTYNCVRYE